MTTKPTLLELSELQDDEYLVPEILPSTAALNFTASVAKVRNLFARAASVTPTREVVPGTAFALLEAMPDTRSHVAHIRLTASDGERTISIVEDGVSVKVPGSALLPPKRVADILRLAPTDSVEFTVVGSSALVRSGRARWTIQVPEGDSSGLTELSSVGTVSMTETGVEPFLRALRVTQVAASTTNARTSLMQIHLKDGAFLASDGGRVHRAVVEGLDATLNTTIPIGAVGELVRALDLTQDQTLEFGFNDSTVVFRIGDDTIVAKKMLLPFPNFKEVLLSPKLTNTHRLLVSRTELSDSIKRVRVNADPEIAVVTLETMRGARSEDDWVLVVKSRDRSGNTAQEIVDCQWSGKVMEVSYNHHHLTDLLDACVGEDVLIRLGNDTKSTKNPLYVEDSNSLTGIVQQVTQHWV